MLPIAKTVFNIRSSKYFHVIILLARKNMLQKNRLWLQYSLRLICGYRHAHRWGLGSAIAGASIHGSSSQRPDHPRSQNLISLYSFSHFSELQKLDDMYFVINRRQVYQFLQKCSVLSSWPWSLPVQHISSGPQTRRLKGKRWNYGFYQLNRL